MRVTEFVAFFALTFAASSACSDGLPEFDGDNYSVKQAMLGDMFLLESDGRDFLCNASVSMGAMAISGCLPFATRSELDALNQAEAERQKALNGALDAVTEDVALASLERLMRDAVQCEVPYGSESEANIETLAMFSTSVGVPGHLDDGQSEKLRLLLLHAIDTLYRSGKLAFTDSSTKIKLVDCP